MTHPPDDEDARPALHDALVVGGGPAGLAAAIQLGRLGRGAVLVDDDAGRSLWWQVTRNYLGFPEGVAAADLRLLGQRQAAAYGTQFRAGRAVTACRDPDGTFRLVVRPPDAIADDDPPDLEPGAPANRRRERRFTRSLGERTVRRPMTLHGRTLILATGVRDAWPIFPGCDLCVGRSLFWCIVCDGYEARGRQVAVVGAGEDAVQTALGLQVFTDRVTLVADRGAADADRLAAVAGAGIPVIDGVVERWDHVDGSLERLLVRRSDGSFAEIATGMVFVAAPKRARSALGRRLGAAIDDLGYLGVDNDQATAVPGLYAAGDVTARHAHQVSAAGHQGATAATAANWHLYPAVVRGERPGA